MFNYENYPNPNFCRKNYILLDGEWNFAIVDNFTDSHVLNEGFSSTINVPYCPESILSGLGYTKRFTHCKYKREFNVTKEEKKRIVLHFGAVDYESQIYINNVFVGKHIGGYTSFSFDITDYVIDGDNEIVVLVYDNVLDDSASGKQSDREESYGCYYTRVTGIWQSVWLEFVPDCYIKSIRFYPNIELQNVKVEFETVGKGKADVVVSYQGQVVGSAGGDIEHRGSFIIPLSEKHLWKYKNGNLYDVELNFESDQVFTYFGLRECSINRNKFLLNGENTFLRLVLDQGYYEKGIYTAENDEEMCERIEMAMQLGFNGARLHQKVFEPKFLYYCDVYGYLVFGEYPSWGINYFSKERVGYVINEWIEEINRDFNHPSIIAWCPANECWNDGYMNRGYTRECDTDYLRLLYYSTKVCDPTRPCLASSGGFHCDETDLYDFHDYGGIDHYKRLLETFSKMGQFDLPNLTAKDRGANYRGQPLLCSEYGGLSISNDGWGYNSEKLSSSEWIDKICELTKLLMNDKNLCGLCYTQLYDVEQEQNGLYTYRGEPKFSKADKHKIYNTLTAKAAIEDEV